MPCRAAKEFLAAHGIEFDARDVVGHPEHLQEMMEVTGGLRGVPVIQIGTTVVRGFNREQVASALGIAL